MRRGIRRLGYANPLRGFINPHYVTRTCMDRLRRIIQLANGDTDQPY